MSDAATDEKHAPPAAASGASTAGKQSDPSVADKEHPASDAAAQSKDTKDTIDVKVFAPFKMYFEGKARGLSGLNESGPFDILAHHHNFISMLLPCDLVVHTVEGEDQTIRITRGLMHVRDNKVIVFLDV